MSVQGTPRVFLLQGGWSRDYLLQPITCLLWVCCGLLAQQSWRCWAGLLHSAGALFSFVSGADALQPSQAQAPLALKDGKGFWLWKAVACPVEGVSPCCLCAGGMMSIFLMGCYDPKSEKWCTVTKCSGGHDDATLARLQTELDMVKISKVRGESEGLSCP